MSVSLNSQAARPTGRGALNIGLAGGDGEEKLRALLVGLAGDDVGGGGHDRVGVLRGRTKRKKVCAAWGTRVEK